MNFWGFDLGDGESAIARAEGEGRAAPVLEEVEGSPVFLTAWALMKTGEVRIGERAARSAASAMRSAARFKSRFLDPQSGSAALIRDFAARALESLRESGSLKGGESQNRFYIGCPAGWDSATRQRYAAIFETLGCPDPHVVSESRAVMVGSVQSNALRDTVDLRSRSVLVVDVGSSTTDFAYINKGREAEIRTGGEVSLGGGVMDETLLERCVALSPQAEKLRRVFAESEAWRVDCELKARRLKEDWFSAPAEKRTRENYSRPLLISYDEPLLLELFLDEEMEDQLLNRPCASLGGLSFRRAFLDGLRQVRESIGEEGPELLFLTGGVSRMEAVRDWCAEVFPSAVIYTDNEPEFSVARGLAWCGRIDDELRRFRAEVEALISSNKVEQLVSERLPSLYRAALRELIDPLFDTAVTPVLSDWRDGKIDTLKELAPVLEDRVRDFLYSERARSCLHGPVRDWIFEVSEALERETSPICRKYHVPDRSLEISSRFEASDLELFQGIDAKALLTGDTLTGAAVLVDSVVSVIIALLCGGSGVALISEGPLGLAIGFLLSLLLLVVGHVLGKKTVDEKLMESSIPLFVRRAALSRPLPRLELRELKLPGLLRQGEGDGALRLPHLSHSGEGDISPRRLQRLRGKILSGYEELLGDPENPELKALNERMSREISAEIEERLKTLAEQVEIPLGTK